MAKRRSTDTLFAAAAALSAARVLRRGWTARFVSRFASIALRHGMRSGSRGWIYAGAGASIFRVLHTFVGRKEEVYRVKLRPGQGLEIREIPRETRRA